MRKTREESRVVGVQVAGFGEYFIVFYWETGNSNKLYNALDIMALIFPMLLKQNVILNVAYYTKNQFKPMTISLKSKLQTLNDIL